MKITAKNKEKIQQWMRMNYIISGWEMFYKENDTEKDTMERFFEAYKEDLDQISESDFEKDYNRSLDAILNVGCLEIGAKCNNLRNIIKL